MRLSLTLSTSCGRCVHYYSAAAVEHFSSILMTAREPLDTFSQTKQLRNSVIEHNKNNTLLFIALGYVSECSNSTIWPGMMTRPNQQGLWQFLGYGILKCPGNGLEAKGTIFTCNSIHNLNFGSQISTFFKKLVHFYRPFCSY